MQDETPVDALIEAVREAGGQSALAEKLTRIANEPVSQARVWNWLRRDMKVPANMCPWIEQLTKVRCERLRPDVNWSVLRGEPALAPEPDTEGEGANA